MGPRRGSRPAPTPAGAGARTGGLFQGVLQAAGAGVAYYAAARLGLVGSVAAGGVTPVWPAAGVAVVVLLAFGYRVLPGIALAAFAAHLSVTQDPLATGLIALGEAAAPGLAVALLRWAAFRPEMDRPRDVLALVFLAGLGGMFVSALAGTSVLVKSDVVPARRFAETFAVWWTGDTIGVLGLAPLLLALGRVWSGRAGRAGLTGRRQARGRRWRRAEAVVLLAGLAAASRVAMWSDLQLLHLVFPFLVWAAWRFHQRGAASAVLLVSGAAVWAAIESAGPFGGSLLDGMVTLQAFGVAVSVTALLLAAVARDRVQLERRGRALEARAANRGAELSAAVGRLKATERALVESQAAARIGSWEWDIGRVGSATATGATGATGVNVMVWSDEMFRIYGYEPAAVPDGFDSFEAHAAGIHPEDREAVADAVGLALRDRQPLDVEHRICRPDGTVTWVSSRGRVVEGAAGQPVRMAGTSLDVTERRQAEDALRQASEREREVTALLAAAREDVLRAFREKSDALLGMCHEVRTPVDAVVGMTELLLGTGLDPAQRGYVETVRSAGSALLRLLDDVVDLSKAEAGTMRLEVLDFTLSDVVEEVASDAGGRAARKGLAFHTLVEAGVPDRLRGDPGRLRRVLASLVGNAVKFTDAGRVTIRVHRVHGAQQGACTIRFEVADTGPGIPAGARDRLFEPFRQGESPGMRRHAGAGLGLALSKRIVGLMGGEIGVDTDPGTGSTFWFAVPLGLATDAFPVQPEAPASTTLLNTG